MKSLDYSAGTLAPAQLFAKAAIEQSISARFEEQVRRWPQRPAVVGVEYNARGVEYNATGKVLSYEALNTRANAIANAILVHGASPGRPVALLVDQGAWQIAAVLGVLKAGCWYAPLDEMWPPDQLSQVVAELEPPIILYSETNRVLATTLAQAAPATALSISLTLEFPAARSNLDSVNSAATADSLAYVFYTSGSTGRPKGVVDNQRNVLHNVMRYTNSLGITHTDGLTLLQHPSFSGAVSSLFCALLNGAAVYPFDVRHEGAFAIASWLSAHPITIYHSVPSLFRQVAASDQVFPNLRIVRLEGDRATWQDAALFQKRFSSACTLVNGLGATECGIVRQFGIDATSAIGSLDGRVIDTMPIGFGVEDMDIVLLDPNGGAIEVREEDGTAIDGQSVGEIGVSSRYLALGYWGRPDLTAARFRPDPADPQRRIYLTGDLGRLTHVGWNARTSPRQELGILEYLGRKDFQVKVRGHWVDLAAVETAVCRIPGVREAMAVAEEDAAGETQIVAYFTEQGASNEAPAMTPGDMRRVLLQTKLPGIMIPTRIVPIEALPLNRHGKVDRAALPAPRPEFLRFAQDRSHQIEVAAPRNPTEARLAEIWGELLGMETVGVFENFFDLGGHSLLAGQLVLHLRGEFGCDLTLRHLIQAPTISALAACLATADPSGAIAGFGDQTPTGDGGASMGTSLAGASGGLPALLPLRTTGSRSPFFLLAGGGGGESEYFGAYAGLLAGLGVDQPIYGFTSHRQEVVDSEAGGASMARLPGTVAAISARCAALIRAVQPHGPYFLGGECTGGKLALEIARLLRAEGEAVALLVLINTTLSAPDAKLQRRLDRRLDALRSVRTGGRSHWLEALVHVAASRLPPILPGWRPLHDIAVARRRYQHLMQTHSPMAYDGDVTLFLTDDRRSEAEGWRTRITSALDVRILEGAESTYLGFAIKPNSERLAALLRSAYDRAETPSG